jgi:hypothetical protein
MKERILKGIFSLSGVSLLLAVAGFVSAVVTMFVDVASTVPTKVVIFIVLLATSAIVILLKLLNDAIDITAPAPPFEHPIKVLPNEKIIVIRRNENFVNNIVVGCYLYQDEIDQLAYIAVVHLIQDKVIQIKIRTDLGLVEKLPTTKLELQALIIRPVVPVTALHYFQDGETV